MILTNSKYSISDEQKLQREEYFERIDSFFSTGIEGYFIGIDNVNIYYRFFLNSSSNKRSIVISNGRSEAVIKYKEVIWDLFNNGYSVFTLDHRGQGFSDRLVDSDLQLGYIDDFENYISDLKTFYDEIVKKENRSKIFLLGHSMGGAIGLRYIERFPNDFHAAAFTSPLLGIPFSNCFLVRFIFGKDRQYAKGKRSYDQEEHSFEKNLTTNSKIRYSIILREYENNPKAKLGGASYRWVKEACKICRNIFSESSKINIPLLLFQGTDELIVDPEAQKRFVLHLNKKNKSVENVIIDGARHELLFEKDEYRIPVLTKILEFFDSHNK